MSSRDYMKAEFGDWWDVLLPVIESDLFEQTMREVEKFYYTSGSKKVCPAFSSIWKAFKACPIDKFKCIVLGQDPYPDGYNATGLAFGIPENAVAIPLSLKNIMDELLRMNPGTLALDFDHTLESWAKQGVLLLNSSLTVLQHSPDSHRVVWEPLMKSIIDHLVAKHPYHPLVVFGAKARNMLSDYAKKYSLVLYSPHPASTRYGGEGAVGSGVFHNTNLMLTDPQYRLNKEPIDWLMEFFDIEPKGDAPF